LALRGCYPGSFDPVTVAHVAIAEAAVAQCGLSSLDLVVSRVALAKEAGHSLSLSERVAAASSATGLRCVATDRQLVVDVADGYDVLVVGADKWAQVLDARFYGDGSPAPRGAALRRLPPLVAVAPRAGVAIGDVHDVDGVDVRVQVLELPAWVADVSSSAVRAGAHHWRAGNGPQTRQRPE
jgi:hypothetical protein